MKLFWKKFLPVLIIFIAFSLLIFIAQPLWVKYNVDSMVLHGANILFLLTSILVFFIQKKALANPNPNVFVRSIIAGMMIKMFSTVIAVLIYVTSTGGNYNTKAVLISLLMYLVYLGTEVYAISKENNKSNA
jgi:hypothetical protein